jgi:diguanylate cyclase (GGDEF)-like protein
MEISDSPDVMGVLLLWSRSMVEACPMQQALQDTLYRLIRSIEHLAGVHAGILLREGRFASLIKLEQTFARCLPSSALDHLTRPINSTSIPQALSRHAIFTDRPVYLIPVRTPTEQTCAAIFLETDQIPQHTLSLIDSVGQTLGLLLNTLDSICYRATRNLHDPLTHLPNQAMLIERLEDDISAAQRTHSRVSVITIDLDGFNEINQNHGTTFGDLVLQRLAARLHHGLRRSDLIARLGEDEFAIVASQKSDYHEVAYLATRMINIIRQPMEINGITVELSASIGMSVYPTDGLDADTLISNSYNAMHRAKIRGRNQFEYYTPQMNAQAMERLELESRLRLAVKKQQFMLNYQPIIGRDGKVCGVEALLRWNHPTQGMIPPAAFIPIAEQTGLIVPIGSWVLHQATHQARQWAIEGFPVRMNVNVSMLQFQKNDFVEQVVDALDRSGLEPHLLELELTESVFIMNEPELACKLNSLRQLGVRIAIDDFGAGYSNLSRLHNLPIDTLKIDRAFVRQITCRQMPTPLHHRTAVLRAMATLANSLGLRLVAEGVECEDQMNFLKRIGYEAMQGYLFSKPAPEDQILELMRQRGISDLLLRNQLSRAA